MIKIFFSEDHEMVRQGIRALFEREKDVLIVGEAGNGGDTLRNLTRVQPDLLLLDLMLPDMSGMNVLEKAKKNNPGLRVLVLSMYDNKVYFLEAMQKGADGYVIKGSSGSDLLKAIRTVMSGHRYVSPQLTEYLMEKMSLNRLTPGTTYCNKLTLREEQVLHLTAEGLSSSDIAERLAISSRTVEAHRNNLMKKLGLHNKAELIRYSLVHNMPDKA